VSDGLTKPSWASFCVVNRKEATLATADSYLKDKKQTAKFLGVSGGSLERLMRSGLPYVKLNGLVRFRPEDIEHFLEARTRRVEQ
jgi:hypothetical protein